MISDLIFIVLLILAAPLFEHLTYTMANYLSYGPPIQSHQEVEDGLENMEWRLNSGDKNIFSPDRLDTDWFCSYDHSMHPMRSGFYKIFQFVSDTSHTSTVARVSKNSELHKKLKEKHEELLDS